jgi:NADPH:quinone reductase-like Zn-dependent oxidoreductase
MPIRQIVVHRAGGHDELRLEERPSPQPGRGEVLVDVRFAGVNYADCVVRMGLYASAKKYVGWPITPGFEVAGTIAAVGDGAEAAGRVGDSVFAVTRFGGYASQLVVPAHQVFAVPPQLTPAEAAGFPAVALTAWYALFELAHPRPGAKVLVHSAAGGVGSMLVQLAKLAGCHVTGVVGASHKVEVVRGLGADAVIDKSREPLWAAAERVSPAGFDVVLDANGVATLGESYRHLAPAGKLVVYGFHSMLPRAGGRPNWAKLAWDWLRTPRFSPLDLTTDNKSVLAFNLSFLFERTDVLAGAMSQLSGWIAAGRLRSPPVKTYPFARVADAHRDLESAQTVGKLVLEV